MSIVKHTVDICLKRMLEDEVLMKSPGTIPREMQDHSVNTLDDWKGWKPIDSIITESDLDQLEKRIGYHLPLSYREFLKHRHFLELELDDLSVNFPAHIPDKDLSFLRKYVFDSWDPELLIEKGLIYFADFHDYGLLCFDANDKVIGNEYKIVFIDHEVLDTIHFYAENFTALLTSDQEAGNRFIEKLNNFYKK